MVKQRSIHVYLFLLMVIVFFSTTAFSVSAEIQNHSIQIDVAIDEEGTAHVAETWRMTIDEGTEIYKPMSVADAQEFNDFEVYFNDKLMAYDDDWDIDDSFEEKAGTYGTNDGELNWGVTSYGTHDYRLEYEITNFVTQTQTDQMIFWKFINDEMEHPPDHITITIEGERAPFDLDTHRIWGFGFSGQMAINEAGQIVAQSVEPLRSENYATLLIRLPAGQYPTEFNIDDRTFDSFVEQAFEGSSYNFENYDPNATYEDVDARSITDNPWARIIGLVFIGGFVLFILIIVVLVVREIKKYADLSPILSFCKRTDEETRGTVLS